MTGWEHKHNGTRRVIYWNEENRVKQIDDNGKSTYFLYDDAGERVLKRGEHGETVYVNRFYSVRNGELGTKHIFAGETRVLSKLVKTPPTVDSNTEYGDFPGSKGILNALGRGKGNKFGIFKRLEREDITLPGTLPVEKDQFYYHTDHLGSSNIITDIAGSVYQHLEYFPYGETWIEEGGSYGGNTPPYKFTGKELDPETGLYYFGARYYDPVLSRWISADPIFQKYLPEARLTPEIELPGEGGIYNVFNLSLYSYVHNNPLAYKDPDGEELEKVNLSIFAGTKSYPYWDKKVAQHVRNIVTKAEQQKIPIKIVSGFRDTKYQTELYSVYQSRLKKYQEYVDAYRKWEEGGRKGAKPVPVERPMDTARPGRSRHESGFAFDINWKELTPEQRQAFIKIAQEEGFKWRGGTDPVHFEADPVRFGYRDRIEAVKENQFDFLKKMEIERKPFLVRILYKIGLLE